MADPALVALALTVLTSVGSLAWFLSRQISEMKDFVVHTSEKIKQAFIEKLEYHERHDDKRFSDIVDDIWELRLRYAAVEGLVLKPKKTEKGD